MLEQFLISKNEIGKFKVTQKNPLGLACEKIIQTPRIFNTAQIKSAIENISVIDIEENLIPELLPGSIEFVLKDFFLFMHQTGLYNRQFNLWRAIANIAEISIFRLQKGLFKKSDLNSYMIDFFIDPKVPSICVIIDENNTINFNDFNIYLLKAAQGNNSNRIKGIFYFSQSSLNEEFTSNLFNIIDDSDLILKYESMLKNFKDARLNIITYKKENEKYVFEPIYPQLKTTKQ